MEDQNQQNPEDVVAFDVPTFIRLLEFAREDATDDEALHKATEKIIELSQDGQVLTMDNYDDIVAGNTKTDTSGMNAVEDKMEPNNKNMNTINEQRWLKLAGLLTENEEKVEEGKRSKTEQKILDIAYSLPEDATLDDLAQALRDNKISNWDFADAAGGIRMIAYPYFSPDLYVAEFTDEADRKRIEAKGDYYKKINNTLYY